MVKAALGYLNWLQFWKQISLLIRDRDELACQVQFVTPNVFNVLFVSCLESPLSNGSVRETARAEKLVIDHNKHQQTNKDN